jgi:hypothetical protein
MRRLFPFILFVSIILGSARGQDRLNDARVWLRLGASTNISERLKWVGKAQIGWENNALKFDFVYLRNEFQLKLNKNVALIGNYTIYEQQTRRENFRTGHRLAAGFKLKHNWGRWEFQWRSLFLSRWNSLLTDEEGMLAKYRNRNRLGVSYAFTKRVTLGVQNEMYLELNQQETPFIGANRFTMSASYKLSKRATLEPNFILIHRDIPRSRDFIYRMSYFYHF